MTKAFLRQLYLVCTFFRLACRGAHQKGPQYVKPRRRVFRARGLHLCFANPESRRRADRRETFGCSAQYPRGAPSASLRAFTPVFDGRWTRVNALMTRHHAFAKRLASLGVGRSPLGAPPWRFFTRGRASVSGIASASVERAPRSQVVVPGGRQGRRVATRTIICSRNTPRTALISISRPAASPPL